MKKKKTCKNLLLATSGLAAAAVAATMFYQWRKREKTHFESLDIKLNSNRNTAIYCTTVIPYMDRRMPLVVLVHGFGADRHEGGRFQQVAEQLGSRGIASIRMDFAGCNDSRESFRNFAIRHQLDDIKTCISYMTHKYRIDERHLGMVGYSMGGRLAALYAQIDPRIHTMALWAPAITHKQEGLEDFMGGKEKLAEMVETAKREGFVVYHDPFGGTKELSLDYFIDMEQYDPLQAISHYKHRLLIVQGSADGIVKPEITERVLASLHRECMMHYLFMEHADHGFGLWDKHPEQSEKLVKETVSFFNIHV